MTVVHIADVVAEVADDFEINGRVAEDLVDRLCHRQSEQEEWDELMDEVEQLEDLD